MISHTWETLILLPYVSIDMERTTLHNEIARVAPYANTNADGDYTGDIDA